MEPVPKAAKDANGTKRGKACNLVESAGKHVTWCKAQENMEPLSSTGKHGTGVKRGKT